MVNYSELSDSDLLILLRNDKLAFDEIYKRYWSLLYRSAFNILKDEALCLDAIQDVLVWFWEHRQTLEIKSLQSYLLVAVKYKIANYIRNGKVRETFFNRVSRLELDYESVDQALEVKELKAFIQQFTNSLPDRCKEIFQLSRNEYLSNKEIALRLGISERTVENQINKALKKLKLNIGRLSVFLPLFF